MIEPREMLGLIPNGLYLIGVTTEKEMFIYTGSWLTIHDTPWTYS